MGTKQTTPYVISPEDFERHAELLELIIYNFPGSTPAAFAQAQLFKLTGGQNENASEVSHT